MFFDGWASVGRIVLSTVIGYVLVVLMLRVSGKRTLAKMNVFDLIVTVALGSTLATISLSKSVKVIDGLAGILTLISLQYVIAWLSVRSKVVRKLVKSEPRLLFHQGQFLEDALRQERVTESEVRAAVRENGHITMHQVAAVVLETDGSFSVMSRPDQLQEPTTLQGVTGS